MTEDRVAKVLKFLGRLSFTCVKGLLNSEKISAAWETMTVLASIVLIFQNHLSPFHTKKEFRYRFGL